MKRVAFLASWLVAAALLLAVAAVFVLSLNHPVNADLAMLHYSAWLINERGFVVYRDIFELNFPAPFLFHSLLGQLVGYEPLPLRVVDLVLLLVLAAASWTIVAPLSRAAASAGFALFALFYFIKGGEYVLERDYFALLPAAWAFALACGTAAPSVLRLGGIAALAAISCSMKPNAVVQLPVLLWMLWPATGQRLQRGAVFFAVMAAVAAVPFAWVASQGGLADFIAIYRDFVPVYANSRYDLWHYTDAAERLRFLLASYQRFGVGACLLAAPGLLWAWWLHRQDAPARRRILQLAAMAFAFTLYEVIAGKFWLNHLFPTAYWTALCLGLLLATPRQALPRWPAGIALFCVLAVAGLGWQLGQLSLQQMQVAHRQEAETPQAWRARRVAMFLLQQGLQPDDRVQVLDMAGDGQAALLMAKATSATRHLIDVPLYMQPESAGTQALRTELVQALTEKPPRFIVYFDQFLHPGGGNRLREFEPLYALLQSRYEVAQQADGEYTIFRRKP